MINTHNPIKGDLSTQNNQRSNPDTRGTQNQISKVLGHSTRQRNVEDYKFTTQESCDGFKRALSVSEAIPSIVGRIKAAYEQHGRVLIWITGAWGTGKTTFGQSLLRGLQGVNTTYLDGDKDFQAITEKVEAGPREGEVVLVAASFIENWQFKEVPVRPIIVNLIADDQTRHTNFFFRAGGPKSTSFDVASAITHRNESPNYILPDSDCIVVDASESCRMAADAMSERVLEIFSAK